MRKKYKPVTPGTRHQVRFVFGHDIGDQQKPKKLCVGKLRSGGRNNLGSIVSYNRGGGNKNVYRKLSYTWKNAIVLGLQYDPNRTGYIALVKDTITDNLHYVLASDSMRVGDILTIENGNLSGKDNVTTDRGSIAIGTDVYSIHSQHAKSAGFVRAAGASATVISHSDGLTIVRLPSGRYRIFMSSCMATIGTVSCPEHFIEYIGKAGRNRNWGWRSSVRGVAMNPIDHPHGGRTNGGMIEITPWALPTKCQRTRSPRKNMFYVIK